MCAVGSADSVQNEAGADENVCVLQLAQSGGVSRGGCCSVVTAAQCPVPSAWHVVCGCSALCVSTSANHPARIRPVALPGWIEARRRLWREGREVIMAGRLF